MWSEHNSIKRHYDLSMSKRTRKSLRFEGYYVQTDGSAEIETDITSIVNVEDELDHTSLKELITGEEDVKVAGSAGEAEQKASFGNEGNGVSLGHHFVEEEKQLQIVTVQHGGGVKLGKMLSRYMKVFNHLIRTKKDHRLASSRKKAVHIGAIKL